jgi:TolB-like protein
MGSMLDELRRRNVHRTALAYLAGSWLLVQVVETLTPDFLPASVFRITVILLAIGFVPALVLAWKFEWTPDGIRREETLPADSERSRPGRFDRAVTVVLVLAVALFAIDKFVFDPARDEAEVLAATKEATKRALSGAFLDEFRDRSVLVLPFLNLSADPEQEYFADGISEEILNILARIEELRVISRSTSWTFKGRDVDVDEVHRELDVSHLLEGSVRKAGDQVRVTAQLIDARTDTHLWSETYDRSLDDVFAIQDDIAVAVADRLHLEILSADSPREEVDPRAYQLFMRGTVQRSTSLDRQELEEKNKLLREALAIEPDYLPALYDLAATHEFLGQQSGGDEFAAHHQAVIDIVDRIEELAPGSIFVSNWRAYMAMRWDADLVAAAPYLETSMRFANRTDVHVWFTGAVDLLMMLGRYDEAMTVAQYWVNRDPYCVNCLRRLTRAAIAAGRRDEAALVLEELGSRSNSAFDFWSIGVAYLASGRPEKALQYFDRIDDESPEIDKGFARAFALFSLGRNDEFEAFLREQVAGYPDNSAEGIARLYAWSGQPDEAFSWLDKMVEDQGPESVISVKTELYDPIKSDPRWTAFLEKYGASDRDFANLRFNPQYPPTLRRAIDSLSSRR